MKSRDQLWAVGFVIVAVGTVLFLHLKHKSEIRAEADIEYQRIVNTARENQFNTAERLAKNFIVNYDRHRMVDSVKYLLEQIKPSIDSIAREKMRQDSIEAASRNAELRKRLKALKSKRDDFEGITWYRDPSSPYYTDRNGFFLYFAIYDADPKPRNLRLRIQYAADDWLFIHKTTIKTTSETYYLYDDYDRDNGYGGIWEWLDLPAESHMAMLRDIASSPSVKIRFEGSNYYRDRSLTADQRAAINRILEVYSL